MSNHSETAYRQEMKDLKRYWYNRGVKFGMIVGAATIAVGFLLAWLTIIFLQQ